MTDFILFLVSAFGDIINFLDNFYILEGLSLLRIFIIIFLFSTALKFLLPKKDR